MTQSELAKELGRSVRWVQTLSAERLAALGWRRIGKGKGNLYYQRLGTVAADDPQGETIEEARRRKLIAEADLLERRRGERDAELKRQGVEEVFDDIQSVLAALPQAYHDAQLSEAQAEVINAAYNKALEGIEAMRGAL